ncbi:MAG TPA: type II toxin-antitoxin system VapC family toxin [Xanthobacteraceae bacterium]|nr:type II toxin-antitoxin system VapC family toxin [Xanthobacteraceae bacterium]
MKPLLLDTCTLIFMTERTRMAPAAVETLQAATEGGEITYVSPITAWEVGMLSSRGRLQLLIRPERWFSNLFEVPGVRLAEMSPDVLIASSFLPGKPPKDPTDRIIAATARELGATLITRDRALLDYGAQGYVAVLEC